MTQGLFAEGWSLPWAYLWAAEGWYGVGLAAILSAVTLHDVLRGKFPRRVVLWAGAAGGIYALLVLTSVALGKFVVYARTTRPIVPCLCLMAGYAVNRLLGTHPRWRPAVTFAVVLAASANLAPNFALVIPNEVKSTIWKKFGSPKQSLSCTGSSYRDPIQKVTRPDLVLVNAQLVNPLREYIGYPAGRVLFSAQHAQSYLPYQYDGLTPHERQLINDHPMFIKLIQLDDPTSVPNNPPDNLLIGSPDPSNGHDQDRE